MKPGDWRVLWAPFREKRFWLFVGILFLVKTAFFLLMGIHVEADSIGYLRLHAGLWHPPGYMAFTDFILRISQQSLSAVILSQTLLFAFSVNWILFLWVEGRRLQWLILAALALDYGSSLYCLSLLSECFYLSLTLLALVPLRVGRGKVRSEWLALLVGLIIGLSYLTRFAALTTILTVAIWWVWVHWRKWKALFLGLAALIVGFQLALLPLRHYYQDKFGTSKINAFTAMSQWNNAAYLLPGSDLARNPRNRFERHLSTFSDEFYRFEATLSTAHIHNPDFPLQQYFSTHHLSTAEIMALTDTMSTTALSLVAERPWLHLRKFYGENLIRPFARSEQADFSEAEAHFRQNYPGIKLAHATWYREIWWIYALLLPLMAWNWWRQGPTSRAEKSLFLLFCLIYLGAVMAGAVMFVRYTYLLAPFLFLGLAVRTNEEKVRRDLGE